MRLRDKAALITGGGRGLGRVIALAFAAEGARLVLASNVEREVQAVAEEARAAGAKAVALHADVTRGEDMAAMTRLALDQFGSVDVLVTAAGIDSSGLLADQDPAAWMHVIDVNLNGTYRAIRAVLPAMMARREGRIITISSVFGKMGGYSFITAYAASKHGVIGLTRSLAAEIASQGYPGITVNAICPGYVRAGMGIAPQKVRGREGEVIEMSGTELFERYLKRRVPQRRMMEAEEIAHVAVFLALPETRGMTGQALNIDGGFFMS